ncbi:phospho-N-acetylmuramoyl-pentapeptide-transferase [candidate division KSB1 bacterium]|nr:phospho-N-acetylmuramoyl-pentapeptide-transferase [candidate division KSB1 bacterium]NIR71832.1 phospho-N-acetylmuramoyl-pentapeptide-transferase [candidate division KSB1 bacterium]NIS25348.1 phospho-N-acetylmuramoyl-pentapeptide-transferase [candidate division KSB1 bacterium]NIT71818.1 phospho-N-acetylmuramoyl-pentapeptide-transferase [candidate division KSB1 bacterium]NIU25556.1 phospho-N-acetylmuramoyl-pentapeptide-transferase [candidate division KSB1 bacterium]
MFYYLLFPLREFISGFNLFRYITFRSAWAAITALFISFVVGPYIIRKLRQHQIGEEIRSDGPQSHLKKAGTPTMGGLIILASVVIPTLLWARVANIYILLILLATVWMGIVGFLDDYLKTVKKVPKGLIARYKLFGQLSLGLIIGSILYLAPQFEEFNTLSTVPFFKNYEIDFGMFYIPMVVVVIIATSNAVNLTDGLDGLAIGLVGISALAWAAIAYVSGRVDFSDYLNIIYLPGTGELTVFCAALVGGALGFLWYNSYPAQVFMGDTGALALGGALGTLAILVKKELLLIIIGGVFVAESLSVIIQVLYYKRTRKRIFKMAPIHHHFELLGWPESKVVVRFWIIAILLVLFSLSTFKIR